LQVGWIEFFGQFMEKPRVLAFQASDDIAHYRTASSVVMP